MKLTPTLRGMLIGGSLTGLAWLIAAGPLSPPAGVVTSTAKTLAEVEPRTAINATNTPGDTDSQFRITAAGSYYLTGNIAGVTGKKGLEVVGPGITIDLNGFTITGPATATDGISIDTIATQGTVTIRNGTVASCRTGINQLNNYGNLVLEGVDVRSCTLGGAIVIGGAVRDSRFVSNTGIGLHLVDRVIVERCISKDNTSHGFSADIGGVIFVHCLGEGNDLDGFNASGCTITACQAQYNAFIGFDSPALITDSYGAGGTTPLVLGGGLATGCQFEGGSSSGVSLSNRGRISHCRISGAGQNGILVSGTGSTVDACTIGACGLTVGAWGGIKVTGGDNTVSDCRVTGMTVGLDDIGIWVTSTGNTIIRNTVAGSSDWYDIAAGNAAGAEVGAAATATTTNPMANIGF